MFEAPNPFTDVLRLIEEAMRACESAQAATSEFPYMRGGMDIGNPLSSAKAFLEEAGGAAATWQDSWEYMLKHSAF